MSRTVNRLFAAALGWIALPALGQLPPLPLPGSDTTAPSVGITSPASGATVSGTITVTAEASDNVGVAGVQFQYNGIDFDAEDTSAPYAATAHTNSVPDGSYTLTAVARDAAGNRTTSEPVRITIANAPPPPPGVARFEESDASYSAAGWDQFGAGWIGWSGGAAVASSLPGAQASFTFTGTSVAWIGYRGSEGGIARVSLDGVLAGEVDLFARSVQVHVPVFAARGLSGGTHTLTIEVTGLKNPEAQFNRVVVDAFHVPAAVVSNIQDTDPDVSFTAGWGPESDPRMSWSNGGATASGTVGAQVSVQFNGTWIGWNGLRSPETGTARVYLDGAFMGEVDTYSPEYQLQGTVFASPPLADGPHTLLIEATGLKNASSTGSRIVVDSFDVAQPGTRFEETDPAVTYTGEWIGGNINRPWSMGTATKAGNPGARATLSFTGTAVSWVGLRQFTTGIARVYVDGVFVAEVDTYAPESAPQHTLFRSGPLAPGNHTLTIEATGRKNPASSSAWIVLDAFDVRP